MSTTSFDQRKSIEGSINRAIDMINEQIEEKRTELEGYLATNDGAIVTEYEDRFDTIQILGRALESIEASYWNNRKGNCLETVDAYQLASGMKLRLPNFHYGSISKVSDQIKSDMQDVLQGLDALHRDYMPRAKEVTNMKRAISDLERQRNYLTDMLDLY